MLVYLSLGSNLGTRESTLLKAVDMISEKVGTPLRRSAFFYSKPWGFSSENDFCNICLAVETSLTPPEVLAATQQIERDLGRTAKTTDRYEDRPIDIDLVEYYDNKGQMVHMKSKTLTLPHPLMNERDFVRVPLAEVR